MIGLLVYMFILLPRFLKKIAVIIGSTVFLLSTIVFFGKLVDLFNASTINLSNGMLPSNIARLNLLKNTLHYILDSFGFGVGAGNISFYLKNESIYPTNHVVEVHNWLAEIMGNFGIGILLGYITMYAYLFIRLYKFYRVGRNRNQKHYLKRVCWG